MKPGKKTYTFAVALLGFILLVTTLAAIQSSEKIKLHPIRLSRFDLLALKPETLQKLRSLDAPLSITYYVSPRYKMPASLHRLEGDVLSLLAEMRHHSNGKFIFKRIDPANNLSLIRELGRKRISSFHIKTVLQDEYSVHSIWSGMVLSYKNQERSIPYIVSDHVPGL